MGFLDIKVSTLTGVIILLVVCCAVGAMIFYQMYQIVNIRFVEMESIK